MKIYFGILVSFVLLASSYAQKDDKETENFVYVEKIGDFAKLGCWGNIKDNKITISHYIVDAKGFRRILNKPGEQPGRYDVSDKTGKKMWVGFRPLGESPYLIGYFPDECFV